MCELDAILLKNDNKERLMESVSKVLVNKNEIELVGILGDITNINGTIKSIDFSRGEIIIIPN